MRKQTTRTIGLAAAAFVAAGTLGLQPPEAAAEAWHNNGLISGYTDDVDSHDVAATGPGDAVAVWDEDLDGESRARAREAVDGTWQGPVTQISPDGRDATQVQVFSSADGQVVALWQEAMDGKDVLFGARRISAGVWDEPDQLTPTTWDVRNPDAGVAPDGTVVIGTDVQFEGFLRTKVIEWQPGPGVPVIDDYGTGGASSFAMGPSGNAILAYEALAQHDLKVVTRTAGGDWGTPQTADADPGFVYATAAAINDSGEAAVVMQHEVDGSSVISQVRRSASGTLTTPTQVSPGAMDSAAPAVAINKHGTAIAAWSTLLQTEHLVSYRVSGDGAAGTDWLNPPGNVTMEPQPAITDAGVQVVAVGSADDLLTFHRLPGDDWVADGSGVADLPPAVAVDPAGHVVLTTADGSAIGHVAARWLDATGPRSTLNAPGLVLGRKVGVSWKATDLLSGVTSVDVRASAAPWNGKAGAPVLVKADAPGSSLSFPAKPGTTYCVHTRVTDGSANTAVSAPRCTTVPLDDRKLVGSGWKRAKGKAHYLGTVTTTTTQGRILVRKGVRARRLALVVAKSPQGGKVEVRFAGKSLGTFSLKGKKATRKIVALGSFASVKAGTLRLTVTSPSGRVVQVDGLVVAK